MDDLDKKRDELAELRVAHERAVVKTRKAKEAEDEAFAKLLAAQVAFDSEVKNALEAKVAQKREPRRRSRKR